MPVSLRLLDASAAGTQTLRLVTALVCSISVTTAVAGPMAYQAIEFRRAHDDVIALPETSIVPSPSPTRGVPTTVRLRPRSAFCLGESRSQPGSPAPITVPAPAPRPHPPPLGPPSAVTPGDAAGHTGNRREQRHGHRGSLLGRTSEPVGVETAPPPGDCVGGTAAGARRPAVDGDRPSPSGGHRPRSRRWPPHRAAHRDRRPHRHAARRRERSPDPSGVGDPFDEFNPRGACDDNAQELNIDRRRTAPPAPPLAPGAGRSQPEPDIRGKPR